MRIGQAGEKFRERRPALLRNKGYRGINLKRIWLSPENGKRMSAVRQRSMQRAGAMDESGTRVEQMLFYERDYGGIAYGDDYDAAARKGGARRNARFCACPESARKLQQGQITGQMEGQFSTSGDAINLTYAIGGMFLFHSVVPVRWGSGPTDIA